MTFLVVCLYSSGIKNIPSQCYQEHTEMEFGEQSVSAVQLCSMRSTATSEGMNGYYEVVEEVPLMESPLSV